jgi:hypothetical protein
MEVEGPCFLGRVRGGIRESRRVFPSSPDFEDEDGRLGKWSVM